MKQLFKADFVRDSFFTYTTGMRDKNAVQQIMLAYRLAKYAQMNKFGGDNIDRPKIAVKIFLFLVKQFRRSYTNIKLEIDVTAILLSYVIRNSYMLTQDDVIKIFGQNVDKKVAELIGFDRIVDSRAKITIAKQSKFKDEISKQTMIMRAAITMAELRTLTLTKARAFPAKVYERYLPVFNAYPDVCHVVANELKIWLVKKLKEAQSSTDYNLTSGNMFSYFTILQDL